MHNITTGRWYHVAVTLAVPLTNSISTIAVQNPVAGSNPIFNNGSNCLLGARYSQPPNNLLTVGWTNYVFGKQNLLLPKFDK
jgi:hypothetical protein